MQENYTPQTQSNLTVHHLLPALHFWSCEEALMHFRCSWVPFFTAECSPTPASAKQDSDSTGNSCFPAVIPSKHRRTFNLLVTFPHSSSWQPLNMYLQSGSEQLQPRHLGIASNTSPWDYTCLKYIYVRVLKHWHMLPREVVDAPPLKTFQVRLYRTLSNLIYLKMSLPRAGRPKPFYDSMKGQTEVA